MGERVRGQEDGLARVDQQLAEFEEGFGGGLEHQGGYYYDGMGGRWGRMGGWD